jgi:endonuclease III
MRARKIFTILKKEFGTPACPLTFKTTEQLAVAVILSAQCTDEEPSVRCLKLMVGTAAM